MFNTDGIEPITRKETDVWRFIETTLLGSFLVTGHLAKTVWDFAVHPATLSDLHRRKDTADPNARPVTFFAVSCALTTGLFELFFQVQRNKGSSDSKTNPFEKLLLDGFASGDIKKIGLALLPFLAGIGLYSYSIARAARARQLQLSFEQSLAFSCYYAGSVLLLYAAVIPMLSWLPINPGQFSQQPWYVYAAACVAYGLLLWFFRSYFMLLRRSLTLSWKSLFSLWVGGIWRFFLWYYALLGWYAPLFFALTDPGSGRK